MLNTRNGQRGGKFPGSTKSAPGVNKPGRQSRVERRAARKEDFNNQNISSAGDFDFNQHNPTGSKGTHVSSAEIGHLRQNHRRNGGSGNVRDSYAELTKQKEAGATFGSRAENMYNNMGDRIQRLDQKKIQNLPEGMDPNDPDVRAAQQGDGWGPKDQARYDARMRANSAKSGNAIDNTQQGINDNVPSNKQINDTTIKNTQAQDVTQDNDINTNVTGDNNKTFVTQDNSVRQYGGDNRSFVYNSNGGNQYSDTPVSAATMAGFYDVDDSPAAQAKFVDMYKDFNKDNNTRFAGEAMKTMAMFDMDARDYTPESMENALGRSTQYSFDRADRQTGHVFGDIWNPDYITEEWKMPSAPGKIESNAEEIAKKAKDDIDDV